ncbi:hypothetical protein ES703_27549 [subsurface metagenome]
MVFLPEKHRKSRFFKIKKEEPEELEEETAEELVKETLEEEEAKAPEAEEKPEEPERLQPPLPTPRKPDVLRQVKEDIYRLKGALKTLKGKLDRKEISQEEYEEKSKKLKLMLANLYEKKIKRELGI